MLLVAVAISTSVALTGCDKVKSLLGGKPSGQVVATVNGKEITSLELRAEMGGFASRDPKIVKQAQQQALQQIILRRIMADKAKEAKLDKSSDFTIQVSRGEENLLAQLYQRKLASKLTAPSKQDADAFVANHPDQFAGRKIMTIEQVITGPSKISPERFKPLNTLDQVKALFDSENVAYQENTVTLDTLSADPRLVDQINKLPPGEVFVVPQGGAIVFNRVTGARTVPFRGDLASRYAMNALRQQRGQDTVRKQIEADRKAAESKIVYAAAYKPATPPAAKAAPKAVPKGAAAPAAAAPAAAAPVAAAPAAK